MFRSRSCWLPFVTRILIFVLPALVLLSSKVASHTSSPGNSIPLLKELTFYQLSKVGLVEDIGVEPQA
jgi:hypothetical protein